MDKRILVVGLLVLAGIAAALWLIPASPLHGAPTSALTSQQMGAAFLGLLLMVGVIMGLDPRDWFDR